RDPKRITPAAPGKPSPLRFSPPLLALFSSAVSLRRLSPPSLSAVSLRRLSPPSLSAVSLRRLSPPSLSALFFPAVPPHRSFSAVLLCRFFSPPVFFSTVLPPGRPLPRGVPQRRRASLRCSVRRCI